MDQKDCIELFKQGKNAWNKWAQARLDERKMLEETDQWDAEADYFGCLIGHNNKTTNWITKANVDFNNLLFRTHDQIETSKKYSFKDNKNLHTVSVKTDIIDFKNFIFPNGANFRNTHFNNDTNFRSATFHGYSDFISTTFNGDAGFVSASFNSNTYFHSVSFNGLAGFRFTKFNGEADFGFTSFNGIAFFVSASFAQKVYFRSASFNSDAEFVSVKFENKADFSSAVFKKYTYFDSGEKDCRFEKSANFNLAHFEKPVSFKQAIFKDTANFASITSDKSFNLLQTDFALVPDFTEAAFHAPPVLDEIEIAKPLIKRPCNWNGEHKDPRKMCKSSKFNWPIANDPTDTRKYRALAKMAAEAKDYQNEMQFFAEEQRCRRFWHDKPFSRHSRDGAGRFWFGLVYQLFSDFGRSFLRPAIGWLGVFIAFAVYYGLTAKTVSSLWDPLYLSLRHGLVISGLTRDGHMKTVLERMSYTDLPAFAFIAQTFISAVFIFLLLLAIRNQFKIR